MASWVTAGLRYKPGSVRHSHLLDHNWQLQRELVHKPSPVLTILRYHSSGCLCWTELLSTVVNSPMHTCLLVFSLSGSPLLLRSHVSKQFLGWSWSLSSAFWEKTRGKWSSGWCSRAGSRMSRTVQWGVGALLCRRVPVVQSAPMLSYRQRQAWQCEGRGVKDGGPACLETTATEMPGASGGLGWGDSQLTANLGGFPGSL